MLKTSLVSGLCTLMLSLAPLVATAAPDYLSFKTEDEANNIEIFKNASPSVVFVTNRAMFRTSFFSRNEEEVAQGSGSGFIWDKSGLIVTNAHVIEGASHLTITLRDHSIWDAELVGENKDKDLAVLRIKAPADKLVPLPRGDSSLLEVGRKVVAIGNPFGLDTTMTVGVVSALGRDINSINDRIIHGVIQTDASINPGNSGGPLLNSLGQLVGVNSQIISPSGASAGIGFSIPVNTVNKVVPQLVQYGRVVRPVMGIGDMASDNWTRMNGISGVVLIDVAPGMPAAKAGLVGAQQNRRGEVVLGDVITEIDGMAVKTQDDLYTTLEQHKAGDTIKVVTDRDGKRMEFKITLVADQDDRPARAIRNR